MRWRAQEVEANSVADRIPHGSTVFLEQGPGEPKRLTSGLVEGADRLNGVRLMVAPVPGVNDCRFLDAADHGSCQIYTFFGGKEIAPEIASGRAKYIPAHWSNIPDALESIYRPSVALLRVSPPDSNGRCWLGTNANFEARVAAMADIVMCEIDSSIPHVSGDTTISAWDIDYVVASETGVIPLTSTPPGEIEIALARNAVSLITPGATVQVGIGKVPEAILQVIAASGIPVAFHSGIVSEPMLDVWETLTGDVGGAAPVVGGVLLGSEEFYRRSHRHPGLSLRHVGHTHDPIQIASIPGFVSINSAIGVDLLGQVNAEILDGKQVAGVGGQLDFVRGSAGSSGGISIIAMPSTAGGKSRIVSSFGAGMAISTPRVDVDYLVTEHGVARLKLLPVRERAEAILSVADPAFRAQLADAGSGIGTGCL